MIPAMLLGASTSNIDREVVAEHRAFWNARTIQEFWSGHAFHLPDEGQRLSYHLAEVLVRRLIADHPRTFRRFLADALYNDAGDGAARERLGCTIGTLAAGFLGPGEWDLAMPELQEDDPT